MQIRMISSAFSPSDMQFSPRKKSASSPCRYSAFLTYHISLLWKNTTTNGAHKWSALRRTCKRVQNESNGKSLEQIFYEDRAIYSASVLLAFGSNDFSINISAQ